MKIDGLTPLLNVEDVSQSAAFYRDVLGFEIESSFENDARLLWVRISRGPVALMLNEHGEESTARRSGSRYRNAVLYFAVEDTAELHAKLSSKGFEPGELHDEEYGVREFGLRDPDGYELAFTSPLPATG